MKEFTGKQVFLFVLLYAAYVSSVEYIILLHDRNSKWLLLEILLVTISLLITHYTLIPLFLARKRNLHFVALMMVQVLLAVMIYCIIHKQLTVCECNLISCSFTNSAKSLLPNAVLAGLYLYKRAKRKEAELKEASNARIALELELLKSQLSPHHLFNCLNTVYSYSLEENSNVSDMILKLSDNLRYVLYESSKDSVLLDTEIQCISNFIDFQKMRMIKTSEITYRVSGKTSNCRIAPMILMPIVENVFKHALGNENNKAMIIININFEEQEKRLTLKCRNSFDNLSRYTRPEGGIGFTNLRKRIAILYPDCGVFETSTQENIFLTTLSIQLR